MYHMQIWKEIIQQGCPRLLVTTYLKTETVEHLRIEKADALLESSSDEKF